MLLDRLDHLGDADLDAEVDDLVAVVGEDDVHQVLADVVDVTLHRGQDNGALAALVSLLHLRFQVGNRLLHGLGRGEHEGELHLAAGEEIADDLHPLEEEVVDDGERGVAGGDGGFQVVVEPDAVPVDDATLQALFDGEVGVHSGVGLGRGLALEELEELLQRVVVRGATVVDEVETGFPGLGVNLGQRHDLAGVDDGRVESGFHTFVEEHRVEHLAGCGVEAEAHVGEAEYRRRSRELGLDAADALDGLDAISARFLHAGRQRKSECVHHDVRCREAVGLRGEVVDGLGRSELPLRGSRLTLFVDAGGDDGSPELPSQRQERVETSARSGALF